MKSINVEAGNAVYSSIDGLLYNKDASELIRFPEGKSSVPKLPETLTSIGDYAFYGYSGLTSLTLPNSLTSIGDHAFEYCSGLTSLTLPNSLTSIGGSAFGGCTGLTSLTLPNSLTSIGDKAFSDCSGLTSLTLPNSLTSIGDWAFSDCSGLTSLTLPNSLTSIGEYAFSSCSKLTSLTLPNSLTSIGDEAFEYCSALEKIINLRRDPIECNPKFSDKVLLNAVLYIPLGTMAEYGKVDPWRNFWNIKEMDPSSIEEIETADEADFRISVERGILTIDGISSSAVVSIYDMQGRCIYNGTGRCFDNLAPGIYMLRVGNKTVKFVI